MIAASLVLATATGGPSPAVFTGIAAAVVVGVIVWFFLARSRKAQSTAAAEDGVVLTITTLPARPVLKQVDALRPTFGVGRPPRSGYQRPIAVLDATELRLTLNGARATSYVSIPRGAITALEPIDFKDRLMRARAIRVTVANGDDTYPLDLVPLDPNAATTVASPEYVDALFAQLQTELGLAAK